MNRLRQAFSIGLVTCTATLAIACTDADRSQPEEATAAEPPPAMTREDRLAMRREMQAEKIPEAVVREETAPVIGEVPEDILNKIYTDLEQRSGGQRADFELVRAESRQWNDGSLGCPEPGQFYTQVVSDGYWIVVKYQDRNYDYRATLKGYFKLCPSPQERLQQLRDNKKGAPSGAPVE